MDPDVPPGGPGPKGIVSTNSSYSVETEFDFQAILPNEDTGSWSNVEVVISANPATRLVFTASENWDEEVAWIENDAIHVEVDSIPSGYELRLVEPKATGQNTGSVTVTATLNATELTSPRTWYKTLSIV